MFNLKSWRKSGLVALSALSLAVTSCGLMAQAAPPAGYGTVPSFADEFNGTVTNTKNWIKTYPWGGRNNGGTGELQYYADTPFSYSNGILTIKATKTATKGYKYTSGMLCSYGKFAQKYGYFEMRAKLPKGKGFWPAFWLIPTDWSWPPEIDIMEYLGHQTKTVHMTHHFNNSRNQASSSGGSYTGPDFSARYHTFGVDWRPGSITWYVDGVQRYKVTSNVPSKPMYIVVNLAVGGGWPGSPDSTTPWPGLYQIDYVRAYPYKG